MKAARLHSLARPLSLDEVPVAVPGPDDVLLRVKACGVCPSDLYVIKGHGPHRVTALPHIPGHEVTGLVASAGSGVTGLESGDRVFINPMVGCGRCEWCLRGQDNLCEQGGLIGLSDGMNGGFAEYLSLPARNVYPLPDKVTFEQGVIITSAFATGFHAVRKAGIEQGDTVAVFGVGATGCSVVQSARAFGAARVIAIDLLDTKLDRARLHGAVDGVNASAVDPASEIRLRTGGRGVDVTFDMVGEVSTIKGAVGSLKRGGRAVLFGTTVEPLRVDFDNYFEEVTNKEITISSVFAYQAREFPLITDFLAAGKIDLSLFPTLAIPLDQVNRAIALSQTEKTVSRIVLIP